jgi:leader peptidase (prepilin peptidase) / N-methyltransferase
MHIVDLALPAMEAVLVCWFLVVGGVFGSFFNVVIYRLPAGISLLRPGSHCPICKHPIRWRDNVPVLGWLLLRGRCRDCRTPISARYPIVEAIVAVSFAAVGAADHFMLGTAAYHLALVCTLLCIAMIELDGHRVPRLVWLPAIVVGGLAPLFWPDVHRVPAWPEPTQGLAAPVVLAVGLALGLALGLAAWRATGPRQQPGVVVAAGLVGLFFGWQAVALLVPISVAMYLGVVRVVGARWPALRPWPLSGMLWLAAMAWIVFVSIV